MYLVLLYGKHKHDKVSKEMCVIKFLTIFGGITNWTIT